MDKPCRGVKNRLKKHSAQTYPFQERAAGSNLWWILDILSDGISRGQLGMKTGAFKTFTPAKLGHLTRNPGNAGQRRQPLDSRPLVFIGGFLLHRLRLRTSRPEHIRKVDELVFE